MSIAQPLLAAFLLPLSLVAADPPPEIPLWPNGAPGSEGRAATEVVTTSASGERSVSSIHNPSTTPYLPAKDNATGTAILVIPGGGHRVKSQSCRSAVAGFTRATQIAGRTHAARASASNNAAMAT